jgi:hypothetical protein
LGISTYDGADSGILMSRYVPSALLNIIPQVIVPTQNINSSRALAVAQIIKSWKELNMPALLNHHISKQHRGPLALANKFAR